MKIFIMAAAIIFSSCSMLPNIAQQLNDPQVFSENNFTSNGVLAFVPLYKMNTDAKMSMDLLNVDSNKTYRISLTPPLKTYSSVEVLGKNVYKSELKRSQISDTVALYALPPGKYITKYSYAYFGDRKSVKGSVSENLINITANEITSLGRTLIPFDAGLFTATIPTMKTIDTNTTQLIKECKSPVSDMKITHITIDVQSK